jgi:FtsP/CotA-like multicopper oxidase with cupredoxin domain
VLATLVYDGRDDSGIGLPASLGSVEALPEPTLPVRRFVLSEGGMMGPGGMRFTINGRVFDRRRVDTTVRLDTVEDWEIVNTGAMDHPFHLHTNPFQTPGERAWKDVLVVPAGERRRIRVRFTDYEGKAFYHCHILDHEDAGMMGVIEMKRD